MDNENGTAVAAVVTTKVEEQKTVDVTSKTEAVDAAIVETVKSADVANFEPKLVESAVNTDELKALNKASNDLAINKTTTTVTVNVTQTKVTTADDANKSQELGEVVSSVTSIAEAAVGAIEKVEKEQNSALDTSESGDIEMVEADTDCEMTDVSKVVDEAAQSVTTTTSTASITENNVEQPKKVEADSAVISTTAANVSASSNEAEHKIDDVEKNISNLFNGDDNVVSTNDKSKTDTSVVSSQNVNDSLKNGLNDGADNDIKSHDAIKDNNDLVSILAGNDKPEESISSSSTGSQPKSTPNSEAKPTTDATSSSTQDAAKQLNSTENKLSKTNVNKSTKIQKQSDASLENESKSTVESEHGLGSKATARQEIISSHSSTIIGKSSDLSTAVTGSESSKSDNVSNITEAVKNVNGVSDETDASIPKQDSPKLVEKASKPPTVDSSETVTPKTPSTKTPTPEDSVFDVNICYNNTDLLFFSVAKQDTSKTATSPSEKSLSALASDSSTLSSSTSEAVAQTLEKTQQEVKGTTALCQFIIDHFEKLREKLGGSSESQKTPATASGRRGKGATNAEPSTPSSNAGKRKRGTAVESPSLNESDADMQPKSAKKLKKEPATPKSATPKAAAIESEYPEKAVLARWVDKKFYAGRVIDQKPNNKFVVLFEDGAKKTLPEEHIVFGKENILPLVNESVHALVVGETYEPGIVQSVETKDDGIYYTVQCESTTVTVTASEIYLEEDQAKVILSKHASNNPEPGFSGALSTRKDRRNKRAESNRQVQWFSESDVSDINESDSRPASPVTVLEAVDGVQPELQHTQKESELVRICYLIERFGSDFKKVNLDNVLGPIVPSNILKNKSFLLTCTIPIKAANGTTERQGARSNGFDLNNRNTVFSTVPFFKDHLKLQIEAAGGTVYSNFENVPTNKYRTCFLLSPFPCLTAKFVQCLASNITAVSHEWIVESCSRNKLQNKDEYVLPAGWSIIENKYKPWSTSSRSQRKNALSKTTIILTSQQNDFVEFWSRVCKSAGAKIRLVKSTNDLTATTKGYILLDDEFPPEYQNRAERFHIPIVSTVWVIQSLIHGKVCDPNAHPKLTQLYEDDCY